MWQDYTRYREDKGHFISEFGFQAPPTLETIESFTEEEDRDLKAKLWNITTKWSKAPRGYTGFSPATSRCRKDLNASFF